MKSATPRWEISQPDFRCTKPKRVKLKNGKIVIMRECQELILGRWEGFVSISRPKAARSHRRSGTIFP